MASIGENIKRMRLDRGLSQSEFARMIGKTRSAVSQYESGTIVPRMGVIEEIAIAFRVSKNEIIGNERFVSEIITELSKDENTLVELYRRMDSPSRRALMTTAEAMAFQSEQKTEPVQKGQIA